MRAGRVIGLTLTGALLTAGLAFAAGPQGVGPHCRLGDRMAQNLGLSETQKAQVKGICERYAGELRQLWRDERAARAARRARAQELHSRMQAEIERVLTPEQRQKLQQMRADRYRNEWRLGVRPDRYRNEWWRGVRPDRYRGEWRRGPVPGARRGPGKLARQLGLTPEQREKVRAVWAAHREELRALMRDARAQGASRDAIRQRMIALREKVAAEVRPILTPEQREKLQALVERWKERAKGQPVPPKS